MRLLIGDMALALRIVCINLHSIASVVIVISNIFGSIRSKLMGIKECECQTYARLKTMVFCMGVKINMLSMHVPWRTKGNKSSKKKDGFCPVMSSSIPIYLWILSDL